MFRDDEPEQHMPRDLKNALFKVEFDVVFLEFVEGFFKVSHELVGLFGLDYNVIHVCLNSLSDEIVETFEHASLVCCCCIFETERHANIAVRSERRDKRSHKMVGHFHRNLMVAEIRIKKLEGFAPRGQVDYLIYAW
jgi:hypothetical protein